MIIYYDIIIIARSITWAYIFCEVTELICVPCCLGRVAGPHPNPQLLGMGGGWCADGKEWQHQALPSAVDPAEQVSCSWRDFMADPPPWPPLSSMARLRGHGASTWRGG